MNVRFAHSPLHTPEQVREIMREASAIADEIAPRMELWPETFAEACRLLGARASVPLMEAPGPLAVGGAGFGLPRL